jgi:hypothetical protein
MAALGFAGCSVLPHDRVLHALRSWLDSWPGIGRVAVGMRRQGFDLQLTLYDERGWRATFYTIGMEHSPTSATGTAWERTPWHATQRAAWEALGDQSNPNERLQLWRLPLVIPDCVAIAMEANGLRALRQRIDFDHQCGGSEDLFAGVALLPVAWTSARLRCAVAGKTTVSELRPNEKADSVRVHNDFTWATTWKRHSHQGLDSNVRPGCGRVDDSTNG